MDKLPDELKVALLEAAAEDPDTFRTCYSLGNINKSFQAIYSGYHFKYDLRRKQGLAHLKFRASRAERAYNWMLASIPRIECEVNEHVNAERVKKTWAIISETLNSGEDLRIEPDKEEERYMVDLHKAFTRMAHDIYKYILKKNEQGDSYAGSEDGMDEDVDEEEMSRFMAAAKVIQEAIDAANSEVNDNEDGVASDQAPEARQEDKFNGDSENGSQHGSGGDSEAEDPEGGSEDDEIELSFMEQIISDSKIFPDGKLTELGLRQWLYFRNLDSYRISTIFERTWGLDTRQGYLAANHYITFTDILILVGWSHYDPVYDLEFLQGEAGHEEYYDLGDEFDVQNYEPEDLADEKKWDAEGPEARYVDHSRIAEYPDGFNGDGILGWGWRSDATEDAEEEWLDWGPLPILL